LPAHQEPHPELLDPSDIFLPELDHAVTECRHGPLRLDVAGRLPKRGSRTVFPVTTYGAALRQVNAAKAVCRACAVRAACLSFGLQTSQDGIWGGTTPEERRALRRQKALTLHDGHRLPIPQATI
jgi:WhiB family transcriptional regulator, redox-sensing transcriptional regulator